MKQQLQEKENLLISKEDEISNIKEQFEIESQKSQEEISTLFQRIKSLQIEKENISNKAEQDIINIEEKYKSKEKGFYMKFH